MFEKGQMRLTKKILGGILIAIALGNLFNIEFILDITTKYEMIRYGILLVAGYFLFVSGRQD